MLSAKEQAIVESLAVNRRFFRSYTPSTPPTTPAMKASSFEPSEQQKDLQALKLTRLGMLAKKESEVRNDLPLAIPAQPSRCVIL